MAKSKKNAESPCTGWWKIVSMTEWDQDFVDEEVPGFIEIEAGGMGHFHFGYVRGNLDARECLRDGRPAVEFSWEGMDEMDECSGRGWAVLEDEELHGMILFHEGDDSGFVAKKAKAVKRPKKRR